MKVDKPAKSDRVVEQVEWVRTQLQNSPREVRWSVSVWTGKRDENTQRKVYEVIKQEPITTLASNEILINWLRSSCVEFQQFENSAAYVLAELPQPIQSPSAIKVFSIHIRDCHDEVASAPIFFPAASEWTVDSIREKWVLFIKESYKSNIRLIYDAMVRMVEQKQWKFSTLRHGSLARARWRELCLRCHPLWSTDLLSETERAEFARVSRDTIFKNLRTGRYQSKNFSQTRTSKRSSRLGKDVKPAVRKSKLSRQKVS